MSTTTALLISICAFTVIGAFVLTMALIMMQRPQALPVTPGAPAPGPTPAAPTAGFLRKNWAWLLFGSLAALVAAILLILFGAPMFHALAVFFRSVSTIPPRGRTWLLTAASPLSVLLLAAILIAVLYPTKYKSLGWAVGVAAFAWLIFSHYWDSTVTCASDDTSCIQAQRDAAMEVAQQKANQARAQEEARARMEQARLVDPAYCLNQKLPHHFGTDKGEPVNRAGECALDLWYKGHCIYAQQVNETKRLGPFCHKDGVDEALPLDIEYAWSADSVEFDDYIRRSQPRYVAWFH